MHLSRSSLFFILMMSLAVSVSAQGPITREYAMEIMAESRWIQVEGVIQENGTFIGKEVDVIAAEDSANMSEVKITGPIGKLDRRRSTMSPKRAASSEPQGASAGEPAALQPFLPPAFEQAASPHSLAVQSS